MFYVSGYSTHSKWAKASASVASSIALVASALVGATLSAAPANAVGTTYYVATTGTATSAAGGSCANPSFVGTNEVPIQAALDRAALSNPATVDYSDVGFAGTYTSTSIVLCAGTWTLANTLVADANVIITGAGYSQTTIKGNGSVRLMHVGAFDSASEPRNGSGQPIGFAARVEISDLTMRNGVATGAGMPGAGGAIRVLGRDSLKVSRVYFSGNSASRGGAIVGYGGEGDLAGISFDAGDVVIDSSAFVANSSASGGTVEFMRYQRNATGAVVKNSSFYGNTSLRILNFDFTNGQSIGNSFVANNPLGNSVLYGGATISVRGNVLAQNDTSSLCGSGLPIGSDSVATAACGAARNGTNVTVSSWANVKALGMYSAPEAPVQRFSLGSSVRGAWPVAQGCTGNDALGVARPVSGSCDAGPLQQPATLSAAPATVSQLTYSNVGTAYSVATAPSNGSGRAVSYLSGDPRVCQVDEITGAFTATYSGTCVINWTIAGTATVEESNGTASVSWVGFPRWSGTAGALTPLHDDASGYSYFVTPGGVIDRLSPSGVFEAGWVKLASRDSWASAISPAGDLYIADWNGPVIKVSASGTVDATWKTLPTDISGIVVNSIGEVFVAGCSGNALTNQITKIALNGTESKVADLPADSCAAEMQLDSLGNFYITDWYRTGLLRVSANGSTVNYMANANGDWSQQLAITSNNDVYNLAINADGFIGKYSATAATYTENWVALPTGCEPTGIAASSSGSLYVSCSSLGKIVEVSTATQAITDAYAPDYALTAQQLRMSDSGKLVIASTQGYALRLNLGLSAQTALVATASALNVGQTGNVTVTGGSTSEPNTYATSTSSICTVSSSGVITAVAAGNCLITVSRAGDSSYDAVTSAVLTVVVSAVVAPPVVVTPPVVTPPVVTPPVVVPPVVTPPADPFTGVVAPAPGKLTSSLTLLSASAANTVKVAANVKTSVAKAITVTAKANSSVSLTAAGFRAGAKVLTCVKSGAKCVTIALSKAGSTGKVVLPKLKFTKAATYVLALSNGKTTTYVKVKVTK